MLSSPTPGRRSNHESASLQRRKKRKRTVSDESTNLTFQEQSEKLYWRWNENLVTIPSIFRHDAEGIPRGTQDKGGQAALKGPRKEKDFLNKLKEFGIGKQAIVLHSLKFRELFDQYNKLLQKHYTQKPHQLHTYEAFRKARYYLPSINELSQEAEIDFLLLVKSKGFFLFEVKSSVFERYHAKEQLEIRRALLTVLVIDAIQEGKLGDYGAHDIPVYCAAIFPSSKRPDTVIDEEYFEDNFSSKETWTEWWSEFIESKRTLVGDIKILYHKVVSRIIYTVTQYMPLTLSEGIVEMGDDIQQQRFLKTFGSMPKLIYDTNSNGESRSTKLTNEQVAVLNGRKRQIIFGPMGCGKTLIIAAKVLDLSLQKKQVLLICGYDCVGLKLWYLNILKLNAFYGHDHLDYVFVCTVKELLEDNECEVVENHCLIDEVNEIVARMELLNESKTFRDLWKMIFEKPFVWIATDELLPKDLFDQGTSNESIEEDESCGNAKSEKSFRVSILKNVLRNTVSIFNEFAVQLNIAASIDSNISIGHDVEGLAVENINVDSLEALCENVKSIITILTQKREVVNDHFRRMNFTDILVYISGVDLSNFESHEKDIEENPSLSFLIKWLKTNKIPMKCTRPIANENFNDPESDDIVLAWVESDILSLEFVAVISCEVRTVASPIVLSRAVSQLFRIHIS